MSRAGICRARNHPGGARASTFATKQFVLVAARNIEMARRLFVQSLQAPASHDHSPPGPHGAHRRPDANRGLCFSGRGDRRGQLWIRPAGRWRVRDGGRAHVEALRQAHVPGTLVAGTGGAPACGACRVFRAATEYGVAFRAPGLEGSLEASPGAQPPYYRSELIDLVAIDWRPPRLVPLPKRQQRSRAQSCITSKLSKKNLDLVSVCCCNTQSIRTMLFFSSMGAMTRTGSGSPGPVPRRPGPDPHHFGILPLRGRLFR